MSDELESRISQLERAVKAFEVAAEAWRDLSNQLLILNDKREARLLEMARLIIHGVIVVALIIAYVIVTVTGADSTAILGILGGYLGGATVEGVANKKGKVTT